MQPQHVSLFLQYSNLPKGLSCRISGELRLDRQRLIGWVSNSYHLVLINLPDFFLFKNRLVSGSFEPLSCRSDSTTSRSCGYRSSRQGTNDWTNARQIPDDSRPWRRTHVAWGNGFLFLISHRSALRLPFISRMILLVSQRSWLSFGSAMTV